jgi:4-hydroxy-tetrahydrodipicolinate synthase
MLTPFDDGYNIDWAALERLIDWYIAAGVHGLFANCQSSEMFHLTDKEMVALARFVVERADGRVPVIASGHTGITLSHQVEQIAAQAEAGVDAVILITNRLAVDGESDERALEALIRLTEATPAGVDLGLYECPQPYKRLMSDAMVSWCAASGRYVIMKDTCCNARQIAHRVGLAAGSRFGIANANAQTLLTSLKAGAVGYSGVMANFHPELYVWLCDNWRSEPEKAEVLACYLSVAALVESLDYPICAKAYQRSIGTFATDKARTARSPRFYELHYASTVEQMVTLGDEMRAFLAL